MSSNYHAVNLLGWSEVIEKDPGTDSPKLRLRKRPFDINFRASG
jgi:hypothetical protein